MVILGNRQAYERISSQYNKQFNICEDIWSAFAEL